MAEIEFKTVAWPSTIKVTPTVAATPPMRGTNPLQDSFIRLEEAERLRQQGKLDRAQRICESLLREHPTYMAALHTLGLIYADKENYHQALNCLIRAAMLNPDSWSTLTALSGIYLELHASEMAANALEQARAINPQDANVLVTLGEIYREEREYDLARDAFAQALKIDPDLVPAATGLGWANSYLGENAEAVATFEALLRRGVQSIEPIAALASLPPSLLSVDLLSELGKYVRECSLEQGVDEISVSFVRVAAMDNASRHKEAWEQAVPANRKVFPGMQEEVRDMRERQRAVLAALRANPIRPATGGQDDKQPISLFILGPSRSGKTTMERLVATLDGVKRGYENRSVDIAIRRTFQTAGLLTNSIFEILPPQLHPLCREIYGREVTRRAGSAKVFTNTHPARIYDAALMASVFPNVRFIFVKRNVDDIVLRMFLRRYREANAYAYDLKTARELVTWYHEMMDLLAEKLPDYVRIIRYEDMVMDPAGALRVAADLCGVPMHDKPLPAIGDDRGCAEPYRQFMAEALQV